MNVILVRTKNGIEYATIIKNYLENEYNLNVVITGAPELRNLVENNNFKPSDTIIHSRTAGAINNPYIKEIEDRGFTVVNKVEVLDRTSNKYEANRFGAEKNIPVAKTHILNKNNISEFIELLNEYKNIVLKPVYSQGQGIFCHKLSVADGEEKLVELLKTVPGDEIQLQQYIDYKQLIRVIVINYKVLEDAMTYDEPTNSWKCSVCLNPNIKHYKNPERELVEIAENTARAFEAKVNFIDFFKDQDGKFILNEINTACNLTFHEEVTGVKIHKYIGDFLYENLVELTKK